MTIKLEGAQMNNILVTAPKIYVMATPAPPSELARSHTEAYSVMIV